MIGRRAVRKLDLAPDSLLRDHLHDGRVDRVHKAASLEVGREGRAIEPLRYSLGQDVGLERAAARAASSSVHRNGIMQMRCAMYSSVWHGVFSWKTTRTGKRAHVI